MFRAAVVLMLSTGVLFNAAFAADKCEVARVAELPILMKNYRPTVLAKINGQDARFVLDSGAAFSSMSSATAAQYNLKTYEPNFRVRISGVGGSQAAQLTKVKEFTLLNVPLKDLEFFVAGSEVGTDTVGLLGQNFLEIFDVEYDLGHGVIRLFQTKHCEHARLAYWLTPEQAYSEMDAEPISPAHPHTIGFAFINGERIKIAFDTGASTSVLSARAAARAGVKLDSEGVQPIGYSHGIGRGSVKTYMARFSSFKIGDGEEIKNAKLRIADTDLGFTEMLLGADFFMSHRLFVGNKEHKLFISYSGGPVFDLSKHADAPLTASDDEPPAIEPSEQPQETERLASSLSQATNASEAARQGAALVSKREFAAGLPLLSKAIELSPTDPEYYYQRGNAYWASGQADLAIADFDQVIKLKQDFLPAYIPRAELQLGKSNQTGALADLQEVDRLAPKQADLRYVLAGLYERTDHLAEAIEQYGLWIDNHPDDSRMVAALAGRCYVRSLQNQDLGSAIKDCDKALWRGDKSNPAYWHIFVDRALVRIRAGDYDKAIADCNEALKHVPKNAGALYVRAVAEARQNKKAESDNDLAAARQINPKVGERWQHFGFHT